ncbi:UNVERIFIED_CONTAM: hypothetical protein FKN15_054838 [Acipenser sinensis]
MVCKRCTSNTESPGGSGQRCRGSTVQGLKVKQRALVEVVRGIRGSTLVRLKVKQRALVEVVRGIRGALWRG